MRYNPEIHHRRSIRLKGYDYGQAGLYFITLCTWQRQHTLGTIQGGEMLLSSFGEVARNEWFRTAQLRPNIKLGEFVVMPNHLHGIVIIGDSDEEREKLSSAQRIEAFGKPTVNTIPTVIRSYKATVTKQVNILRDSPQHPVWQRNYYENVIRSEDDHLRIADYILNNPRRWEEDSEFGIAADFIKKN